MINLFRRIAYLTSKLKHVQTNMLDIFSFTTNVSTTYPSLHQDNKPMYERYSATYHRTVCCMTKVYRLLIRFENPETAHGIMFSL